MQILLTLSMSFLEAEILDFLCKYQIYVIV